MFIVLADTTQIQSGYIGIFCLNTFFCQIRVYGDKARSDGDNDGKKEGMLSPLNRNVSLYPGHNAQFSLSPQQKKKAILKYQVTLCVSHSLYHCHMSV